MTSFQLELRIIGRKYINQFGNKIELDPFEKGISGGAAYCYYTDGSPVLGGSYLFSFENENTYLIMGRKFEFAVTGHDDKNIDSFNLLSSGKLSYTYNRVID